MWLSVDTSLFSLKEGPSWLAFSRMFFKEAATLADSVYLISYLDQVPSIAEANLLSDVQTLQVLYIGRFANIEASP